MRERQGPQERFIDLCRLLGEETPVEADPHGEWCCFEKGAAKTGWSAEAPNRERHRLELRNKAQTPTCPPPCRREEPRGGSQLLNLDR